MTTRFSFILVLFLLCGAITAQAQSSDTSYDDLLNLSLEEMMELDVVTTSKISVTNIAEVPSVISVITAEDIKYSGAKNMEEVLRTVAGFDIVRSGFSPTASFGVRGLYSTEGTNNKILFLINGHPFRSISNGDATVFLANYPVIDVASLEIIRGPGSTLFGAGAFLAVINIKTKEEAKNGTVSVAAGSFNTQEVYASTSVKKKDLKLSLSGNYHRTSGPQIQLDQDFATEVFAPFAPSIGFDGPVSAAPGMLNYAKNTLNLNLNAALANFYLLGGFMQSADQPAIGPIEALGSDNLVKNSASFAELGYKLPLKGDKGEFLVKGYYDGFMTDTKQEWWASETTQLINEFTKFYYAYDPQYTSEPTLYQQGEALQYQTRSNNTTLGGEMNFAYNYENKIKLITGGMYEYASQTGIKTHANGNIFFMTPILLEDKLYAPSESFGGMQDISAQYNWNVAMDRTIMAAFGQAEFNFTRLLNLKGSIHNLALVAGGRYDHYSDAGGNFNPRAALLFSPVEKLYVKALYGEAFRAPSFVELYSQFNPIIVGNSELKPEHVTTTEAVVGVKPNKKSDLSLAYFNTRVSDNIQLVNSDPTQFVSVYSNVGTYTTSGLEADFRYTFKEAAYLFGTFTYQKVLDVTRAEVLAINQEDEQISFNQQEYSPGRAPKLMANLGVNYPLHQNVIINVSGNYLGERGRTEAQQWELDPVSWKATGNIIPLDTREAIPARVLVNAAVTLQDFAFAKGFELQLTGFNLTNADHYNPTLIMRSRELQREGVNFMARLRYSF